MANPLFLLAVVTIATIVQNFLGDFVWQAFHPDADDKTMTQHLFWHTFSYIFPLLPLCLILIGQGLGVEKTMYLFAVLMVLMMTLLATGLSASSASFMRHAKESKRVDGEWQTPLIQTVSATAVRRAKMHNISGFLIALMWWYTIFTMVMVG